MIACATEIEACLGKFQFLFCWCIRQGNRTMLHNLWRTSPSDVQCPGRWKGKCEDNSKKNYFDNWIFPENEIRANEAIKTFSSCIIIEVAKFPFLCKNISFRPTGLARHPRVWAHLSQFGQFDPRTRRWVQMNPSAMKTLFLGPVSWKLFMISSESCAGGRQDDAFVCLRLGERRAKRQTKPMIRCANKFIYDNSIAAREDVDANH